MTARLLALALLLQLAVLPDAYATDELDLILRNVQIIDSENRSEATTVDIRIEKGRVAQVSEESIPAEPGVADEDAEGGYLVGDLEIGLPPRFIIVTENPVENFDVMLNASTYTRFAVNGNEVVTSELADSVIDPAVNVPIAQVSDNWISHNPPPVHYDDSRHYNEKFNAFETKNFTGLFSVGLFLDRAKWLSQNNQSINQPGVGDITDYDGGSIRAFRFGLNGKIKFDRPWHYSLWVATNSFDADFDVNETSRLTAFDYRIDIPLADRMTLSFGKQKEPISLPRLMTLTWNPMQERTSAENAMMPSRNIGVSMNGYTKNERVSWAAGIFNNWIDADVSFSNNSNQYIGRVTWLPIEPAYQDTLFHLGLGYRYDDAKQGLRYEAVPEVRDAPFFVDTGLFDADSSQLLNFEASMQTGPLWVTFELTRNHVETPDLGDLTFGGYHVVGTWAVTGESRPYHRQSGTFGQLPVARDVNHGGFGALELGLRWSHIDLTDGPIEGGEMKILKASATWWFTTSVNVSINYQNVWNEYAGGTGRTDGIVFRAMIFTP